MIVDWRNDDVIADWLARQHWDNIDELAAHVGAWIRREGDIGDGV